MNTNLHNNILKKIESGVIRQKPKWHFILMTLFIVFGLIALSLILLYLVSFITLFLREYLIFDALQFGPRTVFTIMHTLPFLLMVLVITVLLILNVLVRHFAFAYMKPVVVTFGLGLLLTLALFAIILVGDKDSKIARLGEGHRVPGVDMLHARLRDHQPPLTLRGIILSIDANIYNVKKENGDEILIIVTDRTRKDRPIYSTGDRVSILAERAGETFRAIAIRISTGAEEPRMRP